MITANELSSALNGKRSGDGYSACCPAHDDNNPSLSITEANGKVLVYCHTGCTQEEVLLALKNLGLKISPSEHDREFVSRAFAYVYQDAAGIDCLRVNRIEKQNSEGNKKKTFFQERLKNGKWELGGCISAPYRFSKWKNSPEVVLVEGEKCVETLERHGFLATTTPGGSKGWKRHHAQFFQGKRVQIIPDNDEPGREYALAAHRDIELVAENVSIVDLPDLADGEDIVEWFEKGNTPENLKKLFEERLPPREAWESPVALQNYTLPSFPQLSEPLWFSEFIRDVAASLEVPYELVFSFALSALSVANARVFRVQIKPNYSEPVNLWLCPALEPGNRKSAAFSLSTDPLMKWQREEAFNLKPYVDISRSQRKSEESIVAGLRASLAKKKGDERDAILKEIVDLESAYTEILTVPELWTSDVTPERLGVLLMENNERFGFLSDEGGIFDLLAGRYSGGVPNLDLFLKAHAGSPDHTARMGRTVILESATLTVGISPQPSVLQDLANIPTFRGRGLLARFLFTLPASPLGTRTGETPVVSENVLSNYNRALRKMLEKRPIKNDKGSILANSICLSPEAYNLWFSFWKETELKFLEYGELEMIKDWGSKLPGATARIAGLLHLAATVDEREPSQIQITSRTMEDAINIARCLSYHALAAFGMMGADPDIERAKRVLKWIKTKQCLLFTQRDCFHDLQSYFKRVEPLQKALALLIERNFIRERQKQKVSHRTGRSFEVNPSVRDGLL